MDRIPRAIVMTVVIVAVVMIALSIALSAVAPSEAMGFVIWTLVLTFGGILVVGVLVFMLFRKIAGGANADLLKMVQGAGGEPVAAGLPGTATVLSVRDTGITINHINAMMDVGLRVQPGDAGSGQPTYDTKTRVTLGRHSWGAIQPGMTVAVRIDPKNRDRVAIDLQTGVSAQGFGGQPVYGAQGAAAGTVQTAGGSFQVPGVTGAYDGSEVVSTADILATGERGEAEIRGVSHTGATAAQMAPGRQLEAHEADDPMVMIALQVHPRYDPPFDTQAIMRVPDGKLELLAIGKRVPVAWPKHKPDSVTIDWPALR